jgi:hypothetical protein
MKAVEKLFTSGNYDHKNITNKSNVVVPQSILDLIEADGATSEILDTIDTKVFKYRTQITIHGLFNELKNNYIGGYKNMFQNKNLSIGVKYTAIDRDKKQRIFSKIRAFASGWNVSDNSSEYNIYKSSNHFSTKDDYLKLLPEYQKLAESINKDLFFGNVDVYLSKGFFGYFMVCELNIGAIYENNVNALIESVCGESIEVIDATIEQKRIELENKRKAEKEQRDAEANAIAAKKAPYFEIARKALADGGYVKESINIYDGLIVLASVTVNETLEIKYNFKKYTKSKSQKQFRYIETSVDALPENVSDLKFEKSYFERKSDKTVTNAYHKKTDVKPTPEIKKTTEKVEVVVNNNDAIVSKKYDIKIVPYSEFSFVVIGNTKPIKELLKRLGGKFNMYLKTGCGWVFSNAKKENVIAELV